VGTSGPRPGAHCPAGSVQGAGPEGPPPRVNAGRERQYSREARPRRQDLHRGHAVGHGRAGRNPRTHLGAGGANRGRIDPPGARGSAAGVQAFLTGRTVAFTGMSAVSAFDRELQEAVAIKTLRPEALAGGGVALERFKQEIRLRSQDRPPQRGADVRPGRGERDVLPHHGIRGGDVPEAAHRHPRTAAGARDPHDRQTVVPRARNGARAGSDPPRQSSRHQHRGRAEAASSR